MRHIFLLLFIYTSATCIAQQEVVSGNNKLILSGRDTCVVMDPVSGAQITTARPPRPVMINNERIYPADTLKVFPFFKSGKTGEKKLSTYLFEHLQPSLDSLEDGNYILSVNNVVINRKGRLVYYEFNGIKKLKIQTVFVTADTKNVAADSLKIVAELDSIKAGAGGATIIVPADASNPGKACSRTETTETDEGIASGLRERINEAAQKLLAALPQMQPAQIDHTKVNCTGTVFSSWNYIVVRYNKAVFTPFYDGL